jgi:hypothetical protein
MVCLAGLSPIVHHRRRLRMEPVLNAINQGWLRLQHLHGATQSRCPGEAGIGGEQGRI